jgi:hypothetical protein
MFLCVSKFHYFAGPFVLIFSTPIKMVQDVGVGAKKKVTNEKKKCKHIIK